MCPEAEHMGHQNCELNKSLLFTKYPMSGIVRAIQDKLWQQVNAMCGLKLDTGPGKRTLVGQFVKFRQNV
jgi:hypothetical protein